MSTKVGPSRKHPGFSIYKGNPVVAKALSRNISARISEAGSQLRNGLSSQSSFTAPERANFTEVTITCFFRFFTISYIRKRPSFTIIAKPNIGLIVVLE